MWRRFTFLIKKTRIIMKTDEFNLYMYNCIRNGVTIYPKFFEKDKVIKGFEYQANTWYIAVDNNGKEIVYKKPVGTGNMLRSSISKKNKDKFSNWVEAIYKTYEFWNDKINDIKI